MTLQGTIGERSAPAKTPAPDGDPRLEILMDGLSPDEVGERIADRQWLAVEDHVAFQDWVVDTLRDPTPLDEACLYHPDLAVEVLSACRAVKSAVSDQLSRWRRHEWSNQCNQAWLLYRDRRRQWERGFADNNAGPAGEFPTPNIPPALAAELRERWHLERKIRSATAFRRHIDALKNDIETRLQWLYPDAVGGSTLRAMARRDTLGRHRQFYLDRLRHYREMASRS